MMQGWCVGGLGNPPFPMQLGMDPSWKLEWCLVCREGVVPDPKPLPQLLSPAQCPGKDTGAAPTLPAGPSDPNPLPRGNSIKAGVEESRHGGIPAHAAQLPSAAIYPPPGSLMSLIFHMLPGPAVVNSRQCGSCSWGHGAGENKNWGVSPGFLTVTGQRGIGVPVQDI